MTRNVLAALACLLAMSSSGAALAGGKTGPAPAQAFFTEAVQGDLAEIQVGQLAQRNGASPAVKQFGERLVNDHTANLAQAKLVAHSLGLSVPSAPNDQQKAMYARLRTLSGDDFDREFAAHMVQDHSKDIAKFREEAARHTPAGEFARLSLPKLEQHLQIARSLQTSTTGSQ
jgi:putative membrane protein